MELFRDLTLWLLVIISFCLNIGWLYTRLVASNSFSPENPVDDPDQDEEDANEETALLLPRRLNKSVEEFMAMYVRPPLLRLLLLMTSIGSSTCRSSSSSCRPCSSRRSMNRA